MQCTAAVVIRYVFACFYLRHDDTDCGLPSAHNVMGAEIELDAGTVIPLYLGVFMFWCWCWN